MSEIEDNKLYRCPVFVTSDQVTSETLRQLNNAHNPDDCMSVPKYAFFVPMPAGAGNCPTLGQDAAIEVTQVEESKLSQVREHLAKANQRITKCWAELDEQSAADNTVIIYYKWWEESDIDDPDQEQVVFHDRVRFADAYLMVELFDLGMELVVIDDTVIWPRKEDTVNGIFEFDKDRSYRKMNGEMRAQFRTSSKSTL